MFPILIKQLLELAEYVLPKGLKKVGLLSNLSIKKR